MYHHLRRSVCALRFAFHYLFLSINAFYILYERLSKTRMGVDCRISRVQTKGQKNECNGDKHTSLHPTHNTVQRKHGCGCGLKQSGQHAVHIEHSTPNHLQRQIQPSAQHTFVFAQSRPVGGLTEEHRGPRSSAQRRRRDTTDAPQHSTTRPGVWGGGSGTVEQSSGRPSARR